MGGRCVLTAAALALAADAVLVGTRFIAATRLGLSSLRITWPVSCSAPIRCCFEVA